MLLGQGGSIIEAVMITITSFIGMIGISTGMEGFMKIKLQIWERILCIAAGLLLIQPGTVTDIAGIVIIVAIYVFQSIKEKNIKAA